MLLLNRNSRRRPNGLPGTSRLRFKGVGHFPVPGWMARVLLPAMGSGTRLATPPVPASAKESPDH
jgi:hypothetical protein